MRIKALIMDVDGSLTDGGLYFTADGDVMKKFNAKDGHGIRYILSEYGIIPVVLTGRESDIVKKRCRDMGVNYLIQGSEDKVRDLKRILNDLYLTTEEVAYFGDDLNDYDAMKMAGMKGCPNDAAEQIKAIADFVSAKKGGDGAAREFIDWLLKDQVEKV